MAVNWFMEPLGEAGKDGQHTSFCLPVVQEKDSPRGWLRVTACGAAGQEVHLCATLGQEVATPVIVRKNQACPQRYQGTGVCSQSWIRQGRHLLFLFQGSTITPSKVFFQRHCGGESQRLCTLK